MLTTDRRAQVIKALERNLEHYLSLHDQSRDQGDPETTAYWAGCIDGLKFTLELLSPWKDLDVNKDLPDRLQLLRSRSSHKLYT